jgi:2-isopropylmalate synthase
LNQNGRIVTGQGADTDIVIASAKAYLDALNWLSTKGKANPQTDEVM